MDVRVLVAYVFLKYSTGVLLCSMARLVQGYSEQCQKTTSGLMISLTCFAFTLRYTSIFLENGNEDSWSYCQVSRVDLEKLTEVQGQKLPLACVTSAASAVPPSLSKHVYCGMATVKISLRLWCVFSQGLGNDRSVGACEPGHSCAHRQKVNAVSRLYMHNQGGC
jgi:hypothetical protein